MLTSAFQQTLDDNKENIPPNVCNFKKSNNTGFVDLSLHVVTYISNSFNSFNHQMTINDAIFEKMLAKKSNLAKVPIKRRLHRPSDKLVSAENITTKASCCNAKTEATITVSNGRNWRVRRNKELERCAQQILSRFKEKIIKSDFNVEIYWTSNITNNGTCLNFRKILIRFCVIELNLKYIVYSHKLTEILVHQLCHAATWIFNGACGHCKEFMKWYHEAQSEFFSVRIETLECDYKYFLRCLFCDKFALCHKTVHETIRCGNCLGLVNVFPNVKHNFIYTTKNSRTKSASFKKFIKTRYAKMKYVQQSKLEIMNRLCAEFQGQYYN